MKKRHIHKLAFRLPGFALAAVLLLVLIFTATPAQTARADGGGLPTATHTPRPTRTPTVTPSLIPATPNSSGSGLLFVPTNTFTPVANAINQAQPAIGVGETATQEAGGFSLLSCWPFALVFLIVAIAGIWYLSARIRQDIRA